MKHSKGVLTLLVLLFFIDVASAQLARQWVARYSGTLKKGNDVGTALAVDDSGNVYVTGWTTRNGTGTDFATIKYDPDGQMLWVALQDSGSVDKPKAIAVDSANNVYVTGYSGGSLASSYDYLTVKYDRNGNKQWAVKYNNTLANNEDSPVGIAVNDSMNVYVTGYSVGVGTGYDYATVKYDAAGSLKWEQRYNGPLGSGNDKPYAMALRGSSDLYVTGTSADTALDYLTIKYNAAHGDSGWTKRYNGPANGDDIARAIVLRSSSEVYITGSSKDPSNGLDYATIRYDSSGALVWAERYDGVAHGDDIASAISVNSSGGGGKVFVTGKSLGVGSYNDFVTIRYKQGDGALDYATAFNGAGNDDDGAVAVTTGSSPYVLGSSVGAGTGRDYALVQYKNNGPAGGENWRLRYNGPDNSDDVPYAMVLSNSNVYVTGGSNAKKGSSDFLTIKYVDPDEMKYRTFRQTDLTGLGANLKLLSSTPNNANVRDTAFARAYPKIKKFFPGAPGGLLVGNVYLDSAAYGWIRFDKGKALINSLPHTSTSRGHDVIAEKPFIGEKKNPKLDKYNNHIVGELIALRINIGASDAEVTPPTLGDLTYELPDTVVGISLEGMSLRQLASLTDNFLTYWPQYPTLDSIQWGKLDTVLARINRAFIGPLRIVSNQPLVVTGEVLIDSVAFLSPGIAPMLEPLAFAPGSLDETPSRFSLNQNYPNPFNPVTTIEFELSAPSLVTIDVYDVLGRRVASLSDEAEFDDGLHEVTFDGANFASGVYFYRIMVNRGEFHQVKKMLLLK